MLQPMLIQIPGRRKLFIAHLAQIRFLPGVTSLVRVQVARLTEPRVTVSTRKGPLTAVRATVILQIRRTVELLWTLLAGERSLASMDALVYKQIFRTREAAAALMARDRFNTRTSLVYLRMSAHIAKSTERFATYAASVRLLTCVSSHMLLQV